MKTNGNQKISSDYYIGLDVGTGSVGWAVTDTEYNIPKFRGNAMWGVRLFDDAQTSAERRRNRTARRLNHRKHQRLELLDLLFDEEISKVDGSFFTRLKESSLFADDKSVKASYPVFNDSNYTDKDYFKSYPTTYHLRKELINSAEPHDIRLVYLAIHHILKSRGHFLFDMDINEDYKTLEVLIDEFNGWLREEYGTAFEFADKERFAAILSDSSLNSTAKKKQLKETAAFLGESEEINLDAAVDMLAGASVKFSDLFMDDELKQAEKKSLTLNSDMDAEYNAIIEAIGEDRFELISGLKEIFDSAKLSRMLGKNEYICEAKTEQFETNKRDLKKLKSYVRENYPEKYREIFSLKKDKLNNFAAYGKRSLQSGEYSCKQEDFCKYLLKELPKLEAAGDYSDIYGKIKNNCFLPKLKGADNGVIPNQLHRKELRKILDNAEKHLDFLAETDESGISVKEKILSIFDFRVPYYVGPLNNKSPNAWVVRTGEKIYPWNFNKVVNIEESSREFVVNLISKCTYTGDDVLPKESLLFSEYCVLNEINPLSVNGRKIPVDVKEEIFRELFLKSNGKVTKKSIKTYLTKKGYIKAEDEISGVDDVIKSRLKAYHDFSKIMDAESNYDMIEKIISSLTIFGDDKKLFRNWLKNNYPGLDKASFDYICRLKYKDWGSLSRTFLSGIYTPDENGEAHSVIDMLHRTDNNLMQLLSTNYMFRANADAYRLEKYGQKDSISEKVEEMYISPAVKRSLLQTVKIVDEIIDIKKSAPKKIFIEVAREKDDDGKKKRTVSRKQKLLELYKDCKKSYAELYNAISTADESDLRKDALYLYYTQLGKSMYSGQPIDLENLESKYDIDHIFPQSRIKDDSIDNRVLVEKELNRNKSNEYPIKSECQERMKPFWLLLKEKNLISSVKYERLVRQSPLSDEELSSFVARQLVETRQSTKALAEILTDFFKDAKTKIVYSKAGNVSDFRQEFKMVKCRDINDLHHAKDAYLNVVVGNVYDTKFTDKFFRNIRNEE